MSTTRTPLGERLIAALVPHHYPNPHQLAQAAGIAYSTIHGWKGGKVTPTWDQVERLADLVGCDPADLVRAEPPRHTIDQHPEWFGAVARAQERWPGRVNSDAYTEAGQLTVVRLPKHIDEHAAFELAAWVDRHIDKRKGAA